MWATRSVPQSFYACYRPVFFFNLHTSAQSASVRLIALCNASSGSASHLATSHESKFKGAIERLFRIFLAYHEHFTQR